MSSVFFWKQWIKDYRNTWLGLAMLFIFALGYLWFSYGKGTDNVIHWDKIQEQKVIETNVHSFKLGPLTLDVPADNYVILEYFNGSAITPDISAYHIFLLVLAISAVVLITIVTSLDRFWFFAGMTAVILFIVGMRLEVVGIFARYDRLIPIGVLACYVLLAFYFNRFRPSTTFPVRFLCFATLTVVVSMMVYFFADVPFPMIHLALTAYTPALLLTLLFIILTAHEVFAFFILAAGQGNTKNLRHIGIICLVYFINLLITALHEVGAIEWNFIYLNAYFLLSIAAVLGIWGYRERETLYGDIFPFYPLGSFFFLALASIALITTGQLVANDNDPALRVVSHTIIYSHTGYGLIFMVYVIANFIQTLGENKSVAGYLYKPTRMPYFTYRLAGTIAMLAFFFVSFWQGYVWNATAGFYNMSGDLYSLMGNEQYTEAFFRRSKQQSVLNHRANYALATIAASRFGFNDAQEFYESANLRRSSPYSLTNYGNIYLWELEYFKAINAYKEALKKGEKIPPLYNNLAFAYIKANSTDSALYYLNAARENAQTKTTAEVNFFALAALRSLPIKVDSTLILFDTDDAGVSANAIALASLLGQEVKVNVDPLKKGPLNLQQATLLNNYIISRATKLDSSFTRAAFAIASDSLNADFSEAIKASLAYAYYHQGNVRKALEILAELVYRSQAYQGKFNYIMGLWALEQGSPDLAARYFDYASNFDYKQGKLYYAIALTEARRTSEAFAAWDSVLVGDDRGASAIAANMKRILSLTPDKLTGLSDPDLYQFSRYRLATSDSISTERVLNGFKNANYKAQALLDISRRLFEDGYTVKAIQYYQRVAGLTLTDTTLYENVRHFELEMLVSRGEARMLAQQINKGIKFDPSRFLQKVWYTALMADQSGNKEEARKHYEILGSYNPFFVEGLQAAADFFRREDPKGLKAYNILAEAVQTNSTSLKLLRAYHAEAVRMEFDQFADTAAETIRTLEATKD